MDYLNFRNFGAKGDGQTGECGNHYDPEFLGNTVISALSGDANALLDMDGCMGSRISVLKTAGSPVFQEAVCVLMPHGYLRFADV